MIYNDLPDEQMPLPVAAVNVKPGPTQLGSGPSSRFQAEIQHTQRSFEAGEEMGRFTNG